MITIISLTDEQKEDYNVAKAILALHYFQNSEELYNKNYISYVGDEKYIVEDYSYDDNFTALLDILKTGIPTPICACEHAINAISVKQDNDNTSLYYMSVYDNNYPGETRMLELREKVNKSTRFGLNRIIVDHLYDKSDYYYLISDTNNSFTSDDEEISLYVHDLRCFE